MHVRTRAQTTPPPQDHAQRLDAAARMLADARDREALIGALKANLRTWQALRNALKDVTEQDSLPSALSESERRHIAAMAGHVIATTRAATLPGGRVAPDDSRLESFIALNRRTAKALTDPAHSDQAARPPANAG